MAFGTAGKRMMGPLLTANLAMYVIVLGLAGLSLDKYINGQNHQHLGGNPATSYLLIFALAAGTTGACSVIVGFIHLRAWRSSSLAGAASIALVSWAVTALTFGVACKQNGIGNRGRRLRTLEAFIIILAITQLIYLVVLHAGFVNRRYGPTYRSYEYVGLAHLPQKTTTPGVRNFNLPS